MFVLAINSYYPFLYILKWYLKYNGLYTSLRSLTLYIMNGGGTVLYGTRQKVFVPTRVVEFLCAYYVREIFLFSYFPGMFLFPKKQPPPSK